MYSQHARKGLFAATSGAGGWRLAGMLALALICLTQSACINIRTFGIGKVEEVVVDPSPRWFERDRIALVEVDGFIGSGAASWLLGGTGVADLKERLNRAAHDDGVKAVVLRINSPGGEASASDTAFQEILRFRKETGKPVVAQLMGTAASGGYYVALAADRIVAAPTTITGSVGVVMHFINAEGLYGKLGLRSEVIKSGEMKDIGSPTRAMTEQEREVLRGVMTALSRQFLNAVKTRRPQMSAGDLEVIADGRILTARKALELHMVDRVGYLGDAIADARDLAKIDSADVILYRAFPHYNANVYARSAAKTSSAIEEGLKLLLQGRGPTFLYLWSPGS